MCIFQAFSLNNIRCPVCSQKIFFASAIPSMCLRIQFLQKKHTSQFFLILVDPCKPRKRINAKGEGLLHFYRQQPESLCIFPLCRMNGIQVCVCVAGGREGGALFSSTCYAQENYVWVGIAPIYNIHKFSNILCSYL